MDNLKYTFEVTNEDGGVIFKATKPTVEMLEEEIGRWERHQDKFIKEANN